MVKVRNFVQERRDLERILDSALEAYRVGGLSDRVVTDLFKRYSLKVGVPVPDYYFNLYLSYAVLRVGGVV